MKKVYAHGATSPVVRNGEWIYFGATSGDTDYPVCFRLEKIPELIKWLELQINKKSRKKSK